MNLKKIWKIKKEKDIIKGKISWFSPDKIEKQSILDALINARQYARGSLLDMGCGNKPYELIFSGIVENYTGVDLLDFDFANKSDKNSDVRGSVLDLDFDDEKFDTVLSTQVLEHVAEPKIMLKEAFRVIKKGGYLILTAPMSWGLHEIPRDYYRYTEYGLEYLVKNVGFKIVYIKPRGGFWAMVGQRISSRFYNWQGKKKNIAEEILKRILCAIIQRFFLLIDNFDKTKIETLGYIVVAKK